MNTYNFKIILSDRDREIINEADKFASNKSSKKIFAIDEIYEIYETFDNCIDTKDECGSLMGITCNSKYVGWILFSLNINNKKNIPTVYIQQRESWGNYDYLKEDVGKCINNYSIPGQKNLSVGRYIWFAFLDYIKNIIYPKFQYILILNISLENAIHYHVQNGMRVLIPDLVNKLGLEIDDCDFGNTLYYILYGRSKTNKLFGRNDLICGATLCDDCGLFLNFTHFKNKLIWYDCSSNESNGSKYVKLLHNNFTNKKKWGEYCTTFRNDRENCINSGCYYRELNGICAIPSRGPLRDEMFYRRNLTKRLQRNFRRNKHLKETLEEISIDRPEYE